VLTCLVLTTDTLHHRYFLDRIAGRARVKAVLEQRPHRQARLYWRAVARRKTPWALVDNPYLRRSYPRFERAEHEFEREAFGREHPLDLDAHDARAFADVNEPECVAYARETSADLVVSFGTGLIRSELLGLDGLKVNIHRGVLPAYRGLDSDLWAAYFRDFGRIGTTLHVLDERFDTGPVVGQTALAIRPGMRAFHLRYHTTVLAAELVERALDELASGGTVEATAQPVGAGAYYSYSPPLKRAVAIRRFDEYARTLA
jgi:folate-dependent phosphoribosylglycinamide formyltransferase PurN